MTCRDTLNTIHEPFGEPFYYGPERLSSRFEEDEQARVETGHSDSTFKTVFDQIEKAGSEGKRVFIKDIIHYLVPPDGKPASIAPSLEIKKRGIGTEINGHPATNGITDGDHKKAPYPYGTAAEPGNPTVVPTEMLSRFHFTFLIRNPHSSIPSYFRCTIPPLDEMTGFYEFYPNEAGYDEVRRVFEYLRSTGLIGPHHANGWNSNANRFSPNGPPAGAEICVIDADDLLDNPEGIIHAFCKSVGLKYSPNMLNWDNEEDQTYAKDVFAKWKGFHEDAIDSTDLKARTHKKKEKSEAEWNAEWTEKYGEKAAKVIRQTVDANMDDYLYMKQFVIRAQTHPN